MTSAKQIHHQRVLLVAAAAFGVMAFVSAASAGAPGDRRASVCSGRLSGLLSKGVLDLRMIDAGTYDVKFNKTINRCVKVATLGSCFPGVVSGPGEIIVATSVAGGDTVRVRTFTSAGVLPPRDFNLYVDCD